MASSASAVELAELLAEGYTVLPWRQPWAWAWPWSRGRREGAWLAGIAIFLVVSGLVPLTFVMMTLLSVLAMATCLRAYALHEYARQLTELAIQEQQQSAGVSEDGSEGSLSLSGSSSSSSGGVAAAAGASTPARRRPRRPSLFTAVAAARPLSLLNLRLSLMDRDFTEQDFDLLVRLDELEAATRQEPAPPPLPEAQLSLLPVHVHRTTPKKAKAAKKAGLLEAAAAEGAAASAPSAPSSAPAATPGWPKKPGAPPALRVPVLVEAQPPMQPPTPLPQQQPQHGGAGAWGGRGWPLAQPAVPHRSASGSFKPAPVATMGSGVRAGSSNGGESRAPCPAPSRRSGEGPDAQAEIVPAMAGKCRGRSRSCSWSESEPEEEQPLCSICLDSFEDGAKILSLPCRHEYHVECVTQWLRLKGVDSTCPNCKGSVFTPEGTPMAAAAAAAAAYGLASAAPR